MPVCYAVAAGIVVNEGESAGGFVVEDVGGVGWTAEVILHAECDTQGHGLADCFREGAASDEGFLVLSGEGMERLTLTVLHDEDGAVVLGHHGGEILLVVVDALGAVEGRRFLFIQAAIQLGLESGIFGEIVLSVKADTRCEEGGLRVWVLGSDAGEEFLHELRAAFGIVDVLVGLDLDRCTASGGGGGGDETGAAAAAHRKLPLGLGVVEKLVE